MSEEQSPELEHILFDHQKALYKHYYGGREATHEKQPGLTLNLKEFANNISIHFYMQYSCYWLSLPVAGRGSVRARPHLCLVMFNAQERSKGSRWSRTCYLSPATQGILITRVWFEHVRWNHPASNRQSNSEMACWLKKFWNVAMSLPAARCHARNKPFFWHVCHSATAVKEINLGKAFATFQPLRCIGTPTGSVKLLERSVDTEVE